METLAVLAMIIAVLYYFFQRKPKPDGSEMIICQYCQRRGGISLRKVKRKKGISGGKATAAILTLGWSLLATGLAKKVDQTEVHCSYCGMIYYV